MDFGTLQPLRSGVSPSARSISKAGGDSPRGGERHHGVRKADRSTESDRTGRDAAHHAGSRGTPESHAAGRNHGTRRGAKQQRPPSAANPDSARHNGTTARKAVPSNTQPGGKRPPKRTHADQEAPGGSGEAQKRRPGRGPAATAKRRRGQAAPERPPPWTGSSGADQGAGAAVHRTGTSRDKCRWTPRTGSSRAEQAAGAAVSMRSGQEG